MRLAILTLALVADSRGLSVSVTRGLVGCTPTPSLLLSRAPNVRRRSFVVRCGAEAAELLEAAESLKPARVLSTALTLRIMSTVLSTFGLFAACFGRLEGWGPVDAIYFTLTTAVSIGFGDLCPSSAVSRALAAALGCCGAGLLGGLTAGVLGEFIDRELEVEFGAAGEPTRRGAARRAPRWTLTLGGMVGLGTLGFRLCERFSWFDSVYLCASSRRESGPPCTKAPAPTRSSRLALPPHCALLTGPRPSCRRVRRRALGMLSTAGLGDVVPHSRAGRAFASAYALVGCVLFARVVGYVALRPLERARSAAQRAVLARYRAGLSAPLLQSLSSGPLVQRLNLSASDDCCTRAEFALLALVQQGKLSEDDLAECHAAFDALDADRTGTLTRADLMVLEQRRRAEGIPEAPLERQRSDEGDGEQEPPADGL